jgi:NADH:ubiquinone oxidoreductase subunit 6 (subunit J)
MNTDQIGDAICNFGEVYIYAIYAFVILLSLINRRKQKVEVTKNKGHWPISIVAIFGCFLAAGFCIFYSYSFEFVKPGYANSQSYCGLFFDSP